MKSYLVVFAISLFLGCGEAPEKALSAQQIVDNAIDASGGERYENSSFSFDFRDKSYVLMRDKNTNKKVMKRRFRSDTSNIVDTKESDFFIREINGKEVIIPDSLAHKYANSINSVHYFAYLPYGLNDPAVKKKLLGETKIKEQPYYKVQVTFNQENGGDDYDDVYIYWFNKNTFKPDYLAYEFHVDGGGMRLREAYNERFIKGIRFVDYNNFKPREETSIFEIEDLFAAGQLELLSKIELTNIQVTPDD